MFEATNQIILHAKRTKSISHGRDPAMRALLGRKKASIDPTNATVQTLLIP